MLNVPQTPENWESFGNGFSRWVGRTGMKLFGWSFRGELPNEPKLMFAVAPHTSNWDFVMGLFALFALGVRIHWLGKHSIFIWPFRRLLKSWGGIPVYRHAPQGFVEQVADQFKSHKVMHIAIAPEGTRSKVGKLKTGFIRMALAADVPVFRVSIDYPSKQIVFGDLYYPTGELEQDERNCYTYFQQFGAKFPQNY